MVCPAAEHIFIYLPPKPLMPGPVLLLTGPGLFLSFVRRLTPRAHGPMPILSVGRTAAPCQCRKVGGEESPGSMDQRCRITSGGKAAPRGVVAQGKCHREQTAAARSVTVAVRVKRCGKSAPRAPATAAARQTPPGAKPNRNGAASLLRGEQRRPDRSGSAVRVGCLTRRVTGVPEEWPSRVSFAMRHTEPGLQAA